MTGESETESLSASSLSVGLIGNSIGETGSGQSRFIISLAKGLRELGALVRVCALNVNESSAHLLESSKVEVYSSGIRTDSALSKARFVTPLNKVPRLLSRAIESMPTNDWNVVLSDEAVGVSTRLNSDRIAYISQGSINLLYFEDAFYRSNGTLKRLLSVTAARNLRSDAAAASRYRIRLANSEFTRNLMAFLFGVSFSGVVYPPVRPDVFYPMKTPRNSDYVLCVARNTSEPNLDLVRQLAIELPTKVVGGALVPHADSIGILPDNRLAEMYSGAAFLIHVSPSEYFGYPIVEAMACGTPALGLDWGGPGEIITEGHNGWKAKSNDEFIEKATRLFNSGYDAMIRQHALESARRYAPTASAETLLGFLTGTVDRTSAIRS